MTTATVCAVIVTCDRPASFAVSARAIADQTRRLDRLVVVDNGDDPAVSGVLEELDVPSTYLASRRNLGGAGGFAYGILTALALGADWVWLGDDDGFPADASTLETLLETATSRDLAEVSPVVLDKDDPDRLAFTIRQGLTWHHRASELGADFLPGIAALFNGALFRAETFDRIGVPDHRLFLRGDEVEMHRRLARSGLAFGTCLRSGYLHPAGLEDSKPMAGGRLSAFHPDAPAKRFYTYRNRGYLLSQRGMRRLWPFELVRYGWFFLVTRRDPRGLREWLRLVHRGRAEGFARYEDSVRAEGRAHD